MSNAIPDAEVAGRVRLESGSFQNQQMHAFVGGTQGQWGYSLEFMQLGSNGFKELDTGGDTGFEKTDVVAKLQWTSSTGKHKVRWKGAQSGESSRETYLGLSEEDFATTPFRRYAASAKDLMLTDHAHTILGHEFNPTSRWSMTTEVYQTWFARNWYKLDRVVDSTGAKLALGDILADPAMSEALGWLQGASTVPGAGLDVKANNRQYGARGIQHRGRWSFGGSQQHRLTYGVRAHEDFMDRFQWRDRYAMVDGQMALVAAGDSGSAGNRIESARALAGHVRAAFHVGAWTFTPGVRHERMTLARQDFGDDLARLGEGSQRSNDISVWLPGLGAHVGFGAQPLDGVCRSASRICASRFFARHGTRVQQPCGIGNASEFRGVERSNHLVSKRTPKPFGLRFGRKWRNRHRRPLQRRIFPRAGCRS